MTAKQLTHEEETRMNLSWLWPKLILPKSAALERDLANLKPGSAGKPVKQEREDPFSEANLNRRINKMHDQARMNEIGKIAHQLLIQLVSGAGPNTERPYKRHRLTAREVQEAMDSATEIYDMTRDFQQQQLEEQQHETTNVAQRSL